jgi:hypothetical protein
MTRYLFLLVLGAAILADGYVCGRLSGRWNNNDEPARAAVRIQKLPLTLGKWQGETMELNQGVVERAGFTGYVFRRYTNEGSHAAVTMLLACGLPGPLSVHTPEVCYGASGYSLTGNPERWTPNQSDSATTAEFWKATFVRRDPNVSDKLRVVWSWNHKGIWGTADSPRWTYAGAPVLYKLYVTQEYSPRDDATDGEACLDFIRDCLSELDKATAYDR